MDIKEINAYRKGFISGLDLKQNGKCSIFGMDGEQVLDILAKHVEGKTMAKNLKYQWCENSKSDKEFLGWIYDRLQNNGDNFNDYHMRRLDGFIDKFASGTIPSKFTKMLENNPMLNEKREAFRKALNDYGHAEASIYGHWALKAFDVAHGLRDADGS